MANGKYRDLFLTETREHMGAVLAALNSHETGSPLDVDELFRHFHSVKGMANAMNLGPMGSLAHAAEDLLATARRATAWRSPWTPLVQGAAERIGAMIDLFEEGRDLAADTALEQHLRDVAASDAAAAVQAPDSGPVPVADGSKELPSGPQQDQHPQAVPSPKGRRDPAAAPATDVEATVVRIAIDPASKMPAIRAFMALRKIAALGVVTSDPPEHALKAGGLRPASITVRIAAGVPREAVAAAVAVVPEVSVESVEPAATGAGGRPSTGRRLKIPVRVSPETLDRLQEIAGELSIIHQDLDALPAARGDLRVAERLRDLHRTLRLLHETVTGARLVPLGLVTGQIPLRVRELAARLGKDVRVVIAGDDVGMDRSHVEKLEAPLMHIVRNCVDHGIEPPAARAAAGKPPQGVLRVGAARSGRGVRIEIADDGRGIDPERIRDAAVARGVVGADRAVTMTQQELYDLICLPGFSTAAAVTDVSGRGVGLDVVKQTVAELGGEMGIQSTPGAGTTFVLDLPISYVQLHVMIVEASGEVFAVPVAQVSEVAQTGRHGLILDSGRPLLKWRETAIPIRSLSELLCLQAAPQQGEFRFLVLESKGRHLALRVDRLVAEAEVILRPLGAPLNAIAGFSGATIISGGRPVIVLDPIALAGASVFT